MVITPIGAENNAASFTNDVLSLTSIIGDIVLSIDCGLFLLKKLGFFNLFNPFLILSSIFLIFIKGLFLMLLIFFGVLD